MPQDSQVSNVEAISDLAGLVHEVFAGDVKSSVAAESATSQLFSEAHRGTGQGQYRLDGEKLVGASQLRYAGGAHGTDGSLPDTQYQDAVNWETTPGRFYCRRAIDNFTEARGRSGPGTFGDFLGRLHDQMWDAFARMKIRHAIGAADGVICKVSSRTDADTFVVKDGYGHVGCDPLMHLEPGMVIAWVDVSDSNAIKGAGIIDDIDYATKTVDMASAATWEPGDALAANDLIVFATTPDITADYFATEFNRALNGVMTIIDPDQAASTVFGIAEGTNPRWKPFREASTSFDHIEVTEYLRKLRSKSNRPVTRQTHTNIAGPAVMAELARTLVGFQQQQQLGRTFMGGYQAVNISGWDFIEDDFFLQDVIATCCHEDTYNVDLDGEADYFAEDGSRFSRLADFDGKEWWVRHYCQYFADRRNRHGALTDVALPNVDPDDFSPTPNY